MALEIIYVILHSILSIGEEVGIQSKRLLDNAGVNSEMERGWDVR